MANRTTRTMTMNEAGMYIAYTSRTDFADEANFPVSMTAPFCGQEVLIKGYSNAHRAQGEFNSRDHKWIVTHDIDNATSFNRQWANSMVKQGYEMEEKTTWYTTIITTEELLADWDKANSFDGMPCLYWP